MRAIATTQICSADDESDEEVGFGVSGLENLIAEQFTGYAECRCLGLGGLGATEILNRPNLKLRMMNSVNLIRCRI